MADTQIYPPPLRRGVDFWHPLLYLLTPLKQTSFFPTLQTIVQPTLFFFLRMSEVTRRKKGLFFTREEEIGIWERKGWKRRLRRKLRGTSLRGSGLDSGLKGEGHMWVRDSQFTHLRYKTACHFPLLKHQKIFWRTEAVGWRNLRQTTFTKWKEEEEEEEEEEWDWNWTDHRSSFLLLSSFSPHVRIRKSHTRKGRVKKKWPAGIPSYFSFSSRIHFTTTWWRETFPF